MFKDRMRRFLSACALTGFALLASAGTSPSASTPVSVFPIPGSIATLPGTQVVFRGLPADQIGSISVVGSQSGAHSGHIAADSDGQGGSFLPDKPFIPGETVTVSTGLNVLGSHNGAFHFKIIAPYPPYNPLRLPFVSPGRHGVRRFRSRPDLVPASISITRARAPERGDIFVTPQFGPVQNGPMILDRKGRLIWFAPLGKNMLASDLRVQRLFGHPVLTWWQGVTNNGYGRGQGIIVDQHYHPIATVNAADGLPGMDLHEFLVTPQGQAYIIGYSPVHWPSIGKPLMDCVVQEIDINTGLVLFEWHALDHVPISETYFKHPVRGLVYGPYHMNSVSIDRDGNLIVSMRNTWAEYKINHQTGAVMWTLGSNRSSFKLGKGVRTAFQHDLVVQRDGTFTIFDDGAGPPKIHRQSRAIRIAINIKRHTARLIKQYLHSPPLSANFEGDAQLLPDGNMFVGWGQQPYFSEFDRRGRLIFDAHFTAPTSSYRAYRFQWSAQPTTPPDLAAGRRANGVTKIYASWNGATNVSAWRLLGGSSPAALAPIRTVKKRGFETALSTHSAGPYFAVQALGSRGAILGTSATIS